MLVSIGTPMLLMGDEMGRTQRGNNNAYCQDNELSWLDWSMLEPHAELHRFMRTLISQRLRLVEWIEMSGEARVGLTLNELLRDAKIDWHGIKVGQPDWGEDSHSLACTIRSGPGHVPFCLHLMFNAYWEPLDFELPAVPDAAISGWQRWIDTARDSPDDIMDSPTAPLVQGGHCRVMPRSVAALFVRISGRSGAALNVRDIPEGRGSAA